MKRNVWEWESEHITKIPMIRAILQDWRMDREALVAELQKYIAHFKESEGGRDET